MKTLLALAVAISAAAPVSAPRIITLSPALTEIAFAVGAGKEVVGVSEHSDFPSEAVEKSIVGPYTKPLYEKILSLKPTLVLVPQEGPQGVLEQLKRLKIPYEILRMRRLQDIPAAIRKVGEISGHATKGQVVAFSWEGRLKKATSQNPAHHPRVLIELDQEPLVVAGSNTFLSEIVEKCGGQNVYSKMEGYPRLSLETLLKNPADMILVVTHFEKEVDKPAAEAFWRQWPLFKKSKIEFINPDVATRPGPRLIEGAELICKAIARF
jgi:iron complex transport system substrate-binding protein